MGTTMAPNASTSYPRTLRTCYLKWQKGPRSVTVRVGWQEKGSLGPRWPCRGRKGWSLLRGACRPADTWPQNHRITDVRCCRLPSLRAGRRTASLPCARLSGGFQPLAVIQISSLLRSLTLTLPQCIRAGRRLLPADHGNDSLLQAWRVVCPQQTAGLTGRHGS